MALRYYVSSEEAPFFVNNKMGSSDRIPTSGTYKVGDFIISNTQADGIFGWVCTVAGTPGTWIEIGSGGGSNTKTLSLSSSTVVSSPVREVTIGIKDFNKNTDFLMVYKNSTYLTEGVDYDISSDSTKIVSRTGNWNADSLGDYRFSFVVIKEVEKVSPEAVVGTENLKDSVVTMSKLGEDVIERLDGFDSQLEDFMINVKKFGAKGDGISDDTEAIRKAINYANGIDRSEQITVFFPKGTYIVSSKITPPKNTTLRIEGENQTNCYIKPSVNFTDNCIFELNDASKSIYICKIGFTGSNVVNARKISAIEIISGGHGGLYVDNVNCSILRYFIRGGGSAEFPLGGIFRNVYCLNNYVGCIYLGTETEPLSGQSCFTFDNVIVSSSNSGRFNYDTFTVETSGYTDTITVDTTSSEDFGAILMYQKDNGDWEHVSMIEKGQTNKVVTFNNGGKTINYKLIQNTCGVYLKHLKTINIGVMQCEYVGIGLYLDKCRAIKVNSFYNEYRNRTSINPIPQGYGIYLNSTEGFVIDTAWLEGMYNGIYAYNNSSIIVNAITGSVTNSIIFSHQINAAQFLLVNSIINKGCKNEIQHGDPSYKNYEINTITDNLYVKELSNVTNTKMILSRRGDSKGLLQVNEDGFLINCNSLNVDVNNKNVKALVLNKNVKQIQNSINTPLFSFNLVQRASFDFNFYVIGLSGVPRQTVSGNCMIDVLMSDGNFSSVDTIVRNKIQQVGTISDPVFSVNIENGVCTVSILVTSDRITDLRVSYTINSLISGNNLDFTTV